MTGEVVDHGVDRGRFQCSERVGDSGTGGHPGPSNTQGFNLCLLALCTVRP
ncbi:hypothetical protein GTY83_03890 [Streptomyces sp. SID4928]|nr:hypothetical protein [Streptomyces sp. SID4928]